jgi:hypothetical protein
MATTDFVSARRTVLSVPTYTAAERAVDWLSDRSFPVSHVTIVGSGLRSYEQVSERVTNGRAALLGMLGGATVGLVWGLLFALFFSVDAGSYLGVVAYSLIIGILFGSLWGFLAHYATGGKRDFASTTETRADRYEVQVDDAFADDAEKLLARMPAS